MAQLTHQHIAYKLVEEAAVTTTTIKANNTLFAHRPREHNVIINNPDDFELLVGSW